MHKSGSSVEQNKKDNEYNSESKLTPIAEVTPTLLSTPSVLKHHQNKLASVNSMGALPPNNKPANLLPNQALAVNLTFLEEQRIKRFVKESEKFEMATAITTGDSLPKAKQQLSFLRDQALPMMQIMCGAEFCKIFERGLYKMEHYIDSQANLYNS